WSCWRSSATTTGRRYEVRQVHKREQGQPISAGAGPSTRSLYLLQEPVPRTSVVHDEDQRACSAAKPPGARALGTVLPALALDADHVADHARDAGLRQPWP